MLLSQQQDEEVQKLVTGADGSFRLAETDGLVETRVVEEVSGKELWVPVVPQGDAAGGTSWHRWVFLQAHVGIFGGHRLLDQTMRILKRLVWWSGMRREVAEWIDGCMTCIRFRKRPTKQDAVAVKTRDSNCWEEVMVDMEGPSNPTDRLGNKYVMTYICCYAVACSWSHARI